MVFVNRTNSHPGNFFTKIPRQKGGTIRSVVESDTATMNSLGGAGHMDSKIINGQPESPRLVGGNQHFHITNQKGGGATENTEGSGMVRYGFEPMKSGDLHVLRGGYAPPSRSLINQCGGKKRRTHRRRRHNKRVTRHHRRKYSRHANRRHHRKRTRHHKKSKSRRRRSRRHRQRGGNANGNGGLHPDIEEGLRIHTGSGANHSVYGHGMKEGLQGELASGGYNRVGECANVCRDNYNHFEAFSEIRK